MEDKEDRLLMFRMMISSLELMHEHLRKGGQGNLLIVLTYVLQELALHLDSIPRMLGLVWRMEARRAVRVAFRPRRLAGMARS